MKFFLPLISEDKLISTGRVLLWVTFAFMIHFWFWSEYEVPHSLMLTFEWVMGYNFGKKLLNVASNYLTIPKPPVS